MKHSCLLFLLVALVTKKLLLVNLADDKPPLLELVLISAFMSTL